MTLVLLTAALGGFAISLAYMAILIKRTFQEWAIGCQQERIDLGGSPSGCPNLRKTTTKI